MTHEALRTAVAETGRAMSRRGLTQGTSGNLSARVPEGMLITPSAVPYPEIEAGSIILMDLDGRVLEPSRGRPSSEWRLHAAILAARPEVGAVLHTHSVFCTTLACLRQDIPAFHYMVAVAGGDSIRCSRYATFGTPALAAHTLAALEGRRACLMANHGMVALGASPADALALALEVESLAEQYWRARQVGPPVLLSPGEMAEALAAFGDYRP